MARHDEADFVGGLSVSHEGGDLVLTGWDHSKPGGVSVRIVVPGADVLDLIADVSREGTYALTQVVKQAVLGDCGVCGNTGLVDVTEHGRLTNKGCTSCRRQSTSTKGLLIAAPGYRKPDVEQPGVAEARERAREEQRERDARNAARAALPPRKRPARR